MNATLSETATGSYLSEMATGSSLFVDVKTAARMLGLGTTKTWQLVNAGELSSRRFGRAVRIPRRAIEQLVASAMNEEAR